MAVKRLYLNEDFEFSLQPKSGYRLANAGDLVSPEGYEFLQENGFIEGDQLEVADTPDWFMGGIVTLDDVLNPSKAVRM